jgi:hypothetical protein
LREEHPQQPRWERRASRFEGAQRSPSHLDVTRHHSTQYCDRADIPDVHRPFILRWSNPKSSLSHERMNFHVPLHPCELGLIRQARPNSPLPCLRHRTRGARIVLLRNMPHGWHFRRLRKYAKLITIRGFSQRGETAPSLTPSGWGRVFGRRAASPKILTSKRFRRS